MSAAPETLHSGSHHQSSATEVNMSTTTANSQTTSERALAPSRRSFGPGLVAACFARLARRYLWSDRADHAGGDHPRLGAVVFCLYAGRWLLCALCRRAGHGAARQLGNAADPWHRQCGGGGDCLSLPGITVLVFVLLVAAWSIVSGCLMLAAAYNVNANYSRGWMAFGGIVSLAFGV